MKINLIIRGLLFLALLGGCTARTTQEKNGVAPSSENFSGVSFSEQISPRYAEGFQIEYKSGVALVDIQDPQNRQTPVYRYALVPRGTHPEAIPADYIPIEIPVRSVICMTSLQRPRAISPRVCLAMTRHRCSRRRAITLLGCRWSMTAMRATRTASLS